MALESNGRVLSVSVSRRARARLMMQLYSWGLRCLNSPVIPLKSAPHIQDPDFDPQYCPKDKIEVQGVGGRLRDQEEGVFEYKFSSQDLVWSRFGNSVCSPLATA